VNKNLHIDEEGLVSRDKMSGHEILFRNYFKPLVVYATRIIGDANEAEDVVQEVFLNLWNTRSYISKDDDMTSYLFVAVKNGCLKKVRHEKVKHRYENYMKYSVSPTDNPHHYMMLKEIEQCIDETLEGMPQRTQDIFLLSRYEKKKYKEIAVKMDISIKTVELHISKVLVALRDKLKHYLTVVLILIMNL
jgi:RNA polymerase sigma-70 factor (ECF subfamily)